MCVQVRVHDNYMVRMCERGQKRGKQSAREREGGERESRERERERERREPGLLGS